MLAKVLSLKKRKTAGGIFYKTMSTHSDSKLSQSEGVRKVCQSVSKYGCAGEREALSYVFVTSSASG